MIPQHQSLTREHHTPPHVVDAARRVLGEIDLDPASCAAANEVVRAGAYYDDNGLTRQWWGRVFVNPPGGVVTDPAERAEWSTKSRACAWWRKLVFERAMGRVVSAVFIGFTLEILRSAQGDGWQTPMDRGNLLCVPAQRLCFGGRQPTHANVIVGVGVDPNKFRTAFEEIGQVVQT